MESKVVKLIFFIVNFFSLKIGLLRPIVKTFWFFDFPTQKMLKYHCNGTQYWALLKHGALFFSLSFTPKHHCDLTRLGKRFPRHCYFVCKTYFLVKKHLVERKRNELICFLLFYIVLQKNQPKFQILPFDI